MPLSTLPASHAKTWQWSFNNAQATGGSSATDHAANFLAFKNLLLAIPGVPPTVIGSSNGVAAGLDGVDRLSATSDVVAAAEGNAHSWLVLGFGGVATGLQVLFDFGVVATNKQFMNVILAFGFSGGSTTTRPVATAGRAAEVYLLDGSHGVGWFNGSASSFSTRWNIHSTTDGTQYRAIAFQAGVPVCFFALDKLTAPRAGLAKPFCAAWLSGSTSDRLTAALTTSNSSPMFLRGLPSGWPARLGWQFEQTDGRPAPTYSTVNAFSGDRYVWPVVVHSLTHGSRMGVVADLYQGASSWSTADGGPAGGPRKWQAYSTLILAHDGTPGNPTGTALITS